jgi:hypothetical protein
MDPNPESRPEIDEILIHPKLQIINNNFPRRNLNLEKF